MKTLDWHRCLERQRVMHNKTVFTVTELANLSGSASAGLSTELSRLVRRGVLARYAAGKYGLPGAVTPDVLLPHLDAGAYMTGFYALSRHNLVTQLPLEITCLTNRRHNRSRVRQTPVGRFTFVCVRPPLYAPLPEGVLAPPEQALCDFVFIMCRRGVTPESHVTFRELHRLDRGLLEQVSSRYPKTVGRHVAAILARHGQR